MKLLVSVRNCDEAMVVASCNVSVVDLKEPRAGSLGRADKETVIAVADAIHGRAVLSVAMGELVDLEIENFDYLRRYDYIKVGLSRIPNRTSLQSHWSRWTSDEEIRRRAVVVAYADHQRCQSLEPLELANFAIENDAPFFLIDTWNKSGGDLLDWIPINKLRELVHLLSVNNIGVVLAGSLTLRSISQVQQLPITMIAVRGAACVGGKRDAAVDPARVMALQKLIGQAQFAN